MTRLEAAFFLLLALVARLSGSPSGIAAAGIGALFVKVARSGKD